MEQEKKIKKLNTLEFEEHKERVHLVMRDFPQLRLGQAHFNKLYEFYPELANEIRGTKNDPYYLDVRVTDFIKYIKE